VSKITWFFSPLIFGNFMEVIQAEQAKLEINHAGAALAVIAGTIAVTK
jgi:hypothetical protein